MKILLDMDNTLFDFNSVVEKTGWDMTKYNPPCMYHPGFFRDLPLFPGAKFFVESLVAYEYDVWFCSVPLKNHPDSYAEKAGAINLHFPQLRDKLILCQDKGMVKGDILVDDHPEKWDGEWTGIKFDYKNVDYDKIIYEIQRQRIKNDFKRL